jgi:hypothetical protein
MSHAATLTNQNQLQRFSLERTLFWHGILMLNENGGHTFFDVRMKRQVPGAPATVGLYTNDIPPFPLNPTDTLTCMFVLETNQGWTCQRNTICEATLSGSELQTTLESAKPNATVCLVATDTGEWHFELLDKTWALRSIVLYATVNTLKEHIKDF